MKISQLYKNYNLMPQLVTHQLRVAGVAKLVAENWKNKGVDVDFVTRLALVHDMGNLVKFDLSDASVSNKFGQIDNLEYWQKLQKEWWGKYTHDAHVATVKILEESGINQYVDPIRQEEKLYFEEAREERLSQIDPSVIILMYADCRVTPHGVVSYRERIDDLKKRYGGVDTPTWLEWTYWFDQWMQEQTSIDLDTINEEKVTPLFDQLLTLPI